MSLGELYDADYRAFCKTKGEETPRGGALVKYVRTLTNPSLQCVLIFRLANASPRWMWLFWRNVLIHKHACDWTGRMEIGPGLVLPHPLMVLTIPGVKIGANVTLSHDVGLGGDGVSRSCVIEDNVMIYPGSLLIGAITIGEGSIIGAHSFVTKDVPAYHVHKSDGTIEPMRESSFSRARGRSA